MIYQAVNILLTKICVKISMLRSDLCDYSDACIVIKGIVGVTDTNDANKVNEMVTFKNNV